MRGKAHITQISLICNFVFVITIIYFGIYYINTCIANDWANMFSFQMLSRWSLINETASVIVTQRKEFVVFWGMPQTGREELAENQQTEQKLLDNIIFNNNSNIFVTSDYQFGFKPKHSTTSCSFVANEVLQYYLNNESGPVFSKKINWFSNQIKYLRWNNFIKNAWIWMKITSY